MKTPHHKERPTIDHAADLTDRLHDIHNYAHQYLKLTSDWMGTHYNWLANSTGYQESDQV
jgi:hypothetical protein